MLKVDKAKKSILNKVRLLNSEDVEILSSLHRVLAEDIYAPLDLPPFDNSAMDGYAVIASDTQGASQTNPKVLHVLEDLRAGYRANKDLKKGQAIRIMTGAPVPAGADAVVIVENTEREDSRVNVFKEANSGDNIRRRGEDVNKGELVIPAGKVIRPQEIGMFAALNCIEVKVIRRPRVAILATGDELTEIGEKLEPAKIINSNSYSLYAQVLKYGGIPVPLGIARDTKEETLEKIRLAINESADVLLVSGGVSVGDYDVVKDVLTELGMETEFWKVAIKPGKPLLFGILKGILVFGLPGNPVSSMVTFIQFAAPALLEMQGRKDVLNPVINAVCEESISKKPGRKNYLRGIVSQKDGTCFVKLSGSQSSGVLKSMVLANCLIIIPEEIVQVNKGEEVQVQLFDPSSFGFEENSKRSRMGRIISIVGKTNSGKTTLIERIIPELKKKGYKVGVIKHDVHRFEIDHEGKDTWRITQCGADTVIIASGEKMGMVKQLDTEWRIDAISQKLLYDVDVIITEGYKREGKPKIEVTRTGELLCSEDDNLIAIVANTHEDIDFHVPDNLKGITRFDLSDTSKIIDFLEERFITRRTK